MVWLQSFSQWQLSFQKEAVLPLATKLATYTYINDLVQDCGVSGMLAMEILH